MPELPPFVESLVAIFNDQNSTVNTLWGILSAVSLALLGFVYKEQHVGTNWMLLAPLSIVFVVFALGNRRALGRAQRVLSRAAAELNRAADHESVPAGARDVLKAYSAPSENEMNLGHAVTIVLVLVAAWLPIASSAIRAAANR